MKYYANRNSIMLSYYFRYLGYQFPNWINTITFSICCTRTRHYYGMSSMGIYMVGQEDLYKNESI